MEMNNTNLNMDFSLEGMDSLIERLEIERKMKEIRDAKMEQFGDIIKGVAGKYTNGGGVPWIERDDLEQDLWLRILELIRDCGGVENTDASLVAKVAYNKAVDMYRYHRRRYDSKAEYVEGSNLGDNDNTPDYFESQRCEKFARGYDIVLFKEIIDLFEIGSRQRQYVVMKLINYGVIEIGQLDPWDRPLAKIVEGTGKNGKDQEWDYIRELGYKSHCPGSFTVMKREMYSVIHDFLKVD